MTFKDGKDELLKLCVLPRIITDGKAMVSNSPNIPDSCFILQKVFLQPTAYCGNGGSRGLPLNNR